MLFRLACCLVASMLMAWGQPQELAAKSMLAKSYLEAGRFDDASKIYAELVKAMPANPGLQLNLGMALHLAGNDHQAVAVLKPLLDKAPQTPPAQLFLAASYLRTNQPAAALPWLERFLTANPHHAEARQMAADAAAQTGQTAKAVPHLEKLAQLDPKQAALWYELGRAYETLAFDEFHALEKAHPESGPFFAVLAASRIKASQDRAAFFFWKKALEKTPNLRGAHAALAAIYRRQNQAEWAAQEDAAEAKLGKLNCAPPVRSAECEHQAGRPASALALAKSLPGAPGLYWRVRSYDALARAAFAKLEQLPPSPERFRYAAESLTAQGRHPEAAAAWKEALKLAPDRPDLERELAASLMNAKQYAEAQERTSRLLAGEPDAPDLLHLQGDLYLAQQFAEQAVPFLERAAAADPQLLAVRASLARALMQVGRPADALPHVTAALPIDNDGSLHFQLARAYQASGQADAAKDAMAKYQALRAKLKEQDRVLDEEVRITPP